MSTYMLHKLKHHAVPHAGVMVARPILLIRHQIDQVVEADLLGHALQDVDAETIKPAVPGEILFRVHHDVRNLLDIYKANFMRMQGVTQRISIVRMCEAKFPRISGGIGP